jgi:hypothetical protein
MLNTLIDSTRVVGHFGSGGSNHEVCAEATATQELGSNLVTVKLRAFLRATEQNHLGETAETTWLPGNQVVNEHLDSGEAHEWVRDVFASWCHRVATAIP